LGIGGETLPQYAPALKMLARHPDLFRGLISHRVGLDDVGAALELDALKVLVTPDIQGDTL